MITRILSFALLPMALAVSSDLLAATSTLTAVADTELNENEPSTPHGDFSVNRVGSLSLTHGVARNRTLFRFDPAASIPAGSLVTSVELTLNVYRVADATPFNFDLRKISVSWSESNATWQFRDTATDLWGAFGGLEGTDFSSTASASLGIGATGPSVFSSTATLVSDVQSWLDIPASNFGWMLLTTSEDSARSARKILTHEYAAAPPSLVVTYTSVPEPGVSALLFLSAVGWVGVRVRRNR